MGIRASSKLASVTPVSSLVMMGILLRFRYLQVRWDLAGAWCLPRAGEE